MCGQLGDIPQADQLQIVTILRLHSKVNCKIEVVWMSSLILYYNKFIIMIMTKSKIHQYFTVKDCCKCDEHSDLRIFVWDSSGSKWVNRYKPMPTARTSPVAVASL